MIRFAQWYDMNEQRLYAAFRYARRTGSEITFYSFCNVSYAHAANKIEMDCPPLDPNPQFGVWSAYRDRDAVWFRLFGYGLHINRSPMLFSFRSGQQRRRYLPFPGGWRLRVLKP